MQKLKSQGIPISVTRRVLQFLGVATLVVLVFVLLVIGPTFTRFLFLRMQLRDPALLNAVLQDCDTLLARQTSNDMHSVLPSAWPANVKRLNPNSVIANKDLVHVEFGHGNYHFGLVAYRESPTDTKDELLIDRLYFVQD